MNPNTTGAIHPGTLNTSARSFRKNVPLQGLILPAFTMPVAPMHNSDDLMLLTAAINHMSVNNALLPGSGKA